MLISCSFPNRFACDYKENLNLLSASGLLITVTIFCLFVFPFRCRNESNCTHSTADVGSFEDGASDLLFVGSGSVLVEGGEVSPFLGGAEGDGLGVAVDGQVILPRLEVLVALVLGPLGPVQWTLEEEEEGEDTGLPPLKFPGTVPETRGSGPPQRTAKWVVVVKTNCIH